MGELVKLYERVSFLEAQSEEILKNIERLRNHIAELLTFKNKLEGGMKTVTWILTFVGITNIILVMQMFFK